MNKNKIAIISIICYLLGFFVIPSFVYERMGTEFYSIQKLISYVVTIDYDISSSAWLGWFIPLVGFLFSSLMSLGSSKIEKFFNVISNICALIVYLMFIMAILMEYNFIPFIAIPFVVIVSIINLILVFQKDSK